MDEMEDYRLREAQGMAAMPSTMRHVPMRTQLTEERKHHQHEVERITQLLELLEQNPAIEQFINLQRGYKL